MTSSIRKLRNCRRKTEQPPATRCSLERESSRGRRRRKYELKITAQTHKQPSASKASHALPER